MPLYPCRAPPGSTSAAAEKASKNPNISAIANHEAAKEFGLSLIQEEPCMDREAFTRFWVLGKVHQPPSGHDKTALLVVLEKSPPANLWRTLGCFVASEDHGRFILQPQGKRPLLHALSPIPIPGKPFEYNFLLVLEGHREDETIKNGLANFESSRLGLWPPTLLGSFPQVDFEAPI